MGARILNMYVYTDGIKGGCKVELTTDGGWNSGREE